MKILVLQLARFGDIYLTWPTMRALHRLHPEAELHLLVREKFVGGTNGLANVNVHTLPTAQILGHGIDSMETRLQEWLKTVGGEWEMIVNLSFSPFSSYLTDFLATEKTIIRGYTRHADGFLSIPDDGSAYFYAQVGTDRPNRFHLADIFAMVAQVEIQKNDWGYDGELQTSQLETPYIVVHLGASQSEKRYPLRHFKKVLQKLSHVRIYLIGSKEEQGLAETLLEFSHVKSLIGQTQLTDLFSIIKSASLLIGGDSAPIHIAAHTNTPVLNLSFSFVNFWETGPTSAKCGVLYTETPEELTPERVVLAVQAMLSHQELPPDVLAGELNDGPRFETAESNFCWDLIQALYTNASYPSPTDPSTLSGIDRLAEIVEMALEQLTILKSDFKSKKALEILNVVDVSIEKLKALAPELAPLLRWFETERLRMPPQDLAITFEKTEKLFQDLMTISQVLRQEAGPNFELLQKQGLERIREIQSEIGTCAMSFRFYQTAKAEPMLQRMLSHLAFFDCNGLHHATPTKVQGPVREWQESYQNYREVLQQLIQAFQKQDYVFVADLIEYEVAECLSEWRTHLVKFDPAVLV